MSEKHQCKGIKANGEQCTRRATQGDYCKTHSKGNDIATCARGVSTPQKISMLVDEGFSPSYQSMLEICRNEIANPSENTMQMLQWVRLQMDLVRHAKEEMRLLENMGATSEYYFTVRAPKQQDIPVIDVEVDEERVLN